MPGTSDSELNEIIQSLVSHQPNIGEKSIDGLLRAQSIVV